MTIPGVDTKSTDWEKKLPNTNIVEPTGGCAQPLTVGASKLWLNVKGMVQCFEKLAYNHNPDCHSSASAFDCQWELFV